MPFSLKIFKTKIIWMQLGVLLSILGLVVNSSFDCSNRAVSKEQWHKSNAIAVYPKMVVQGIDSLCISMVAAKKDIFNPRNSSNMFEPDTINARVELSFFIKITNQSEHTAKPILIWASFANTGYAELREDLLSKGSKIAADATALPFYSSTDIPAKKTIIEKITLPVAGMNDSTMVLHFLFIYENQLGILYDTYYFARLVQRPILTRIEHKLVGEHIIRGVRLGHVPGKEPFSILDTNQISDYYSINKASIVRKKIEAALKEIAK